ncbi:LOW QUALITY PROTEIN: hypothetical protein MSG28_013457, partial [Choristoneura fumiferana]
GVERVGGAGGAEALNGAPAPAPAPPERADSPPRKRARLALADDAPALRRRLLEYTEQLSELFFLQSNGNMMDYAGWRKRPQPQLLAAPPARRHAAAAAARSAARRRARPRPHARARAGPRPAPAPAPAAPASPADEMVEKARQEAYVAGRVAELARAGLWAERRLPRVCEPPRAKTHWDYLLEEMAWLAQDFAHERKWKKQAAKKCARAVQKYFQDKAVAAQKAEKAQELQLKRIAAFAAKEIKLSGKIWGVERERRVERARKQALDEQLSYIVDRTERYSRQLAANLHGAAPDTPPSDDEFTPRGASSDDEETIAAAEREARHDAAHHRRELLALRSEADQALPDLLPPGYPRAAPAAPASPASSDYSAAQDSTDDEATIAAQEREERAAGPRAAQDEIDALQQEADLDLEELRRRYAARPTRPTRRAPPTSTTATTTTTTSTATTAHPPAPSPIQTRPGASARRPRGCRRSWARGAEGGAEGGAAGSERRVEAAASLAATLQPTGTTRCSRRRWARRCAAAAGTRCATRGLHWLATMHARRLNGILADEMGLGKTIQTIALLAHLALERRDWGPHLVVAPTSVVLNWEMEFKKWCPAFKVLTYYGTIKERKLKRVGWTKPNCFHVCITSYKLVVQDHQSFRRKRWRYLVLDEAQKHQELQEPALADAAQLPHGQNSLLELWSLMHFLMPDVFASHSEFRDRWRRWRARRARGGAGGGALVRRLHEVLRPFLLRRLKADVERQMPRKYEHVLLCRLAKRQRCLYDDFMARAKTKESLASGNLLSVINVLMQLRKVCNHPDLFEPRPVSSPLLLPALRLRVPALALHAGVTRRARAAARLAGDLASLEAAGGAPSPRTRAPPRAAAPPRRGAARPRHDHDHGAPPPAPAPARLRLHLRL